VEKKTGKIVSIYQDHPPHWQKLAYLMISSSINNQTLIWAKTQLYVWLMPREQAFPKHRDRTWEQILFQAFPELSSGVQLAQ
jgi:hypothetical protein